MQMNTRGALCAPGCTRVSGSEDAEGTFHWLEDCPVVSFPVHGRVLTSLSVAPEHAGKVSEGVKPFLPAKTTRKTVLWAAASVLLELTLKVLGRSWTGDRDSPVMCSNWCVNGKELLGTCCHSLQQELGWFKTWLLRAPCSRGNQIDYKGNRSKCTSASSITAPSKAETSLYQHSCPFQLWVSSWVASQFNAGADALWI